jgi:hypothetical protein
MPKASVTTITRLKPGFLDRTRMLERMSRSNVSIGSFDVTLTRFVNDF